MQSNLVSNLMLSGSTRCHATTPNATSSLPLPTDVEYAEPDYVVYKTSTNDPGWAEQWALPQINIGDAWAYTKGSTSVKVCVIDTGGLASQHSCAFHLCTFRGDLDNPLKQ